MVRLSAAARVNRIMVAVAIGMALVFAVGVVHGVIAMVSAGQS